MGEGDIGVDLKTMMSILEIRRNGRMQLRIEIGEPCERCKIKYPDLYKPQS